MTVEVVRSVRVVATMLIVAVPAGEVLVNMAWAFCPDEFLKNRLLGVTTIDPVKE